MIKKNILITGAKGFIGKNLVFNLKARGYENIYEFDSTTDTSLLDFYCQHCDFVFHLAGINRPQNENQFMEGNYGFTLKLLECLKRYGNTCPVMLSSSIQAESDNAYGISKKAGEDLLKDYGESTGAVIYIYRFSNIFGKWCRPNYNSVVATFCHNILNGKELQIHNPDAAIQLVYIDDVIEDLILLMEEKKILNHKFLCSIPVYYDTTVGEIADMVRYFFKSRQTHQIPYLAEHSLEKKMYSTFISYLPENQFSYPLDMHIDERGSFTEILRTAERGQISVNIIKPGIEKGNHWHNTKNEKFCVVSGTALIQLRKPGDKTILSYHISGDKIEVVDIPCGYTHNIINKGTTDLITLMWCNECFNPEKPDTFSCKVNGDAIM